LKRGLLTEAEEQLVIDLHARLGNRLNLFSMLHSYIHIVGDELASKHIV
jgi:hypothetical protein